MDNKRFLDDFVSNWSRGKNAPFRKFIIMDVILEPSMLTEDRLNYYSAYDIKNITLIHHAPKNSCIAKAVQTEEDSIGLSSDQCLILAPFFPPHLALPCKPGEFVWAFFDNVNEIKNFGYWICRITTKNFVEDLNYTHYPRQFDFLNSEKRLKDDFISKLKKDENGSITFDETKTSSVKKSHVFNNTILRPAYIPGKDGIPELFEVNDKKIKFLPTNFVSKLKSNLIGKNEIKNPFLFLLTETDASKQINYEAVPSFLKRPADLVIEGSNNNIVSLGTEIEYSRFNLTRDEYQILNNSKILNLNKENQKDLTRNTGVVDILVGIRNKKYDIDVIDNDLGRLEKKKFPLDENKTFKKTGLPDLSAAPTFRNTKSRIYVSQNSNPDFILDVDGLDPEEYEGLNDYDNFFYSNNQNLLNYNNKIFGQVNDRTRASIIEKSDTLRYVARNDIQIIVKPENDNSDEDDITTYSSITIKSNGDIILKPSNKGFLKLGGEDADKVPLCAEVIDFNVTENPENSYSSFKVKPIQTSGGQKLGYGHYSGSIVNNEVITSIPLTNPPEKQQSSISKQQIFSGSFGIFASRVLIK